MKKSVSFFEFFHEILLYFVPIFVAKDHDFLIFASQPFLIICIFPRLYTPPTFVCGLIKRLVKNRSFSYAGRGPNSYAAKSCLSTDAFFGASSFRHINASVRNSACLEKQGDENRRFSTAEQNRRGCSILEKHKNISPACEE